MSLLSQKDNEAIAQLPDAQVLLGGLKEEGIRKDQAATERAIAMDKFFKGYEILFRAVVDAGTAGNVTCKLAILNLLKLHKL